MARPAPAPPAGARVAGAAAAAARTARAAAAAARPATRLAARPPGLWLLLLGAAGVYLGSRAASRAAARGASARGSAAGARGGPALGLAAPWGPPPARLGRPHALSASSRLSSSPLRQPGKPRAAGDRRKAAEATGPNQDSQIEVLYDGLCRVCLANKAVLESQDSRGLLRFVNIAADDYDAADHADVQYSEAMNELHIIVPDGQILRGADAVFHAYGAVGLDWAVAILRVPVWRWFTDTLYRWISQNRKVLSQWVPGGEALREQIRSARFLQKGVAEGEGCNEEAENDEDDDCMITVEKLGEDMGG